MGHGAEVKFTWDINWDMWRKQQFVAALLKFLARFPKKRNRRVTKRPEPLWRYEP